LRDKKTPFILGLSKPSNVKYLHCSIHQGARLIPYPEQEGWFQCPMGCGPIPPTQTASDTKITSRFTVKTSGRQIASGHNRSYREKQYYDKTGVRLPKDDKDILQDLARGATIVSYHTTEDLTANTKDRTKEYRHIVKR